MINNDVLRSLRFMLNISDAKVAEIIGLTDLQVSEASISACLKKEDEDGFTPCSDELLAHVLDGLVILRRLDRLPTDHPLGVERLQHLG